ncbi:Ig-like domain-containing protein [Levilactobacillus huananensis]|uniref:Ig-like domain-containing protein n=1 Tax=Levilactobacillus huananensis TaxID=2486019 RepID=UPI000F78CBCD|nr:Ig-like domain-containing protein [Levilactobacillus huananensis]
MSKSLGKIVITTLIIGSCGLLPTTSFASQKTVAHVSKIRVTRQHVYGRTTKKATVKIQTLKGHFLGKATVNHQGRFVIKTKKNLKKSNFKFKVSKHGYRSRTTTYAPIVTIVSRTN